MSEMQDMVKVRLDELAVTPTVSRLARLAAYTAAAAGATSAGAAIYSQTGLSIDVGFVGGGSNAVNNTVAITGAGGATALILNGVANYSATGMNFRRWAGVTGAGAAFRTVSQSASVGNIAGGLPVAYGANWGAPGRSSTEFADWRAFGTGAPGGLNFSTSAWSDFQQAGDGSTWYLLFRFTQSSQAVYGWLAFTATIEGFGGSSSNFIRITGWGWDDTGALIGAGFTGSAIPGGGALAALAAGAVGLRSRRRQR
ncbi:MAG: hypothetical protein ACO38V_08840 [Phycisphaerales bacterium]|jgi:hypothetical protein